MNKIPYLMFTNGHIVLHHNITPRAYDDGEYGVYDVLHTDEYGVYFNVGYLGPKFMLWQLWNYDDRVKLVKDKGDMFEVCLPWDLFEKVNTPNEFEAYTKLQGIEHFV